VTKQMVQKERLIAATRAAVDKGNYRQAIRHLKKLIKIAANGRDE
jgi:hypothetical protein